MKTRSRAKNQQINYAESDDNDTSDEFHDSGNEHSSSEEDQEENTALDSEKKRTKRPTPSRSKAIERLNAKRMAWKTQPPSAKRRKPAIAAPRTIRRANSFNTVNALQRRAQERSAAKTPYELARERLHVSAVPDSLPCREDEFADIMGFLEGAIEAGTGTCIYVAGVPGTGKTATVLEIIRHLQNRVDQEELPPFNFVEINGMKITDPSQAYSILWQSLCHHETGDGHPQRRVTSAHALELLEARFSDNREDDDQRTTVVLMDELDLLVTKKQTVMYNFFEWPNRPHSKLVVVAIANTMDLPERMLSNKVSSRLGLTRINFEPYTHQQLYRIVESRLEGIEEAFEPDAVEFAARKVSAVSGDARRALDICRRAVEIIEGRGQGAKVTIMTINEAIKEMLASPFVASVQSYALHQKLFLVSVMHCMRQSGLGEVKFSEAAMYHIRACTWSNLEPPTMSDLMVLCQSLGQARALVIEDGRTDLMMRISLNVSVEDIKMGCKDDRLITRLLANS
ncbi:P-loop containing nucleoside triphosphate hydrolase protein [Dichotomocladium elegans]|nr:P-loop containing nucleoside triphosphate hydrolase protein [Dichotomocladium elegans]